MIEVSHVETMAYAGATPWHGSGTKVAPTLSAKEMLEAAELNWSVTKVPAFVRIGDKEVSIGQSALLRESDDRILDIVSNDWNILQNEEAFDFFHEFVEAGELEMHTAGSLKNGQFVWALAKMKESFELFKGDQVESYLLFTNPHKYGWSIDIRTVMERVVCHNTWLKAIRSSSQDVVKVSHRSVFDMEYVHDTLKIARRDLEQYKEVAEYLGSKRYNDKTLTEYFRNVFPINGPVVNGETRIDLSRSATKALEVVHTQPGANFAEGSWWSAYNTVTYMTDHVIGRSNDSRLKSAWYGQGKNLKTKALEVALDFAKAA